jgi:hypothetical protein
LFGVVSRENEDIVRYRVIGNAEDSRLDGSELLSCTDQKSSLRTALERILCRVLAFASTVGLSGTQQTERKD